MPDQLVDFQRAFDALPGSFLLVAPDAPAYTILAISDELLRSTARQRAQVVGRSVFEVYPENPAAPTATGPASLRTSLQNACRTKQPDQMPVIRYDVPTAAGVFEARYWSARTQPVLDAAGEVQHLLAVTTDVTAQVQAEKSQHALREIEQAYHLLLQAPVGVCLVTGPAHVVALANGEMQRLLGTTANLVGQPLFEALPAAREQGFPALLDQVRQTGQPFRNAAYPAALLLGGGQQLRYYNFVCEPYYETATDKTAAGVFCVAHDVTEQVRARQKAEESREELKRYQFMADQARDPFILMRADGTFAYLNTKALESWGYTAQEAEHLRVPDVDPVYQEGEFNELFARAQLETIAQFETQHRRKDGHVFPVELSIGGLLLGGQPHLLAVARDISGQKHALEALRESEERFRIMANAAPNLVWEVNPDSTIRYINQSFLEFVGVSEAAYLATGWTPYMHPQELALAQQTLTQAIEQRTLYTMEHRMRRHDGQFRWLLAQGAPSYYPNGELYGYVGSAIDITELKQANEQLMRTNNDLDNFVYTASHDLKAPISNIEGLLQALLRTLPPDTLQSARVQRLTGLMQESIERFTKTIANLTDVVKLQKEHGQEAGLVNLAEVVQDVCFDLEPLRRATGAQVEVDVAACPTVRFSAKNLRSVVYNLLSNALKYHAPDRPARVALRCESTPEYQVLVVADNGLGMAAERQGQLFTMFRRFHDHVEGSGIGLYMVKKMVENAGGRIEVKSTAGVGSTFRIFFRR